MSEGHEPEAALLRSRSRVLVLAVAVMVMVSGMSWWLGSRIQSADQAASRAREPEPSWITEPVAFRTIEATLVFRGDVQATIAVGVDPPSSVTGTAVITRLPPEVGSRVVPGDLLVEVSGRPVFVLRGSVPAYRTLQPGMKGADVRQLQAGLARLGYATSRDGRFDVATSIAVTAFYADRGYVALPSSETAVADLDAARGAVRDAEAAVAAAELALAEVQRGPAGSQRAAAEAALDAAHRALADARADRDAAVRLAEIALDNAQSELDRLVDDPGSAPAAIDAARASVAQSEENLAEAEREGADAIMAAESDVRVAQLALDELRASPEIDSARLELDGARTTRDAAAAALAALVAATGPTVPQGEIVFVPITPARVRSAVGTLGPLVATGGESEPAETGSRLVELSAGELVVEGRIRDLDAELVRVGMDVVLLDEATGAEMNAKFAEVAVQPTATDAGLIRAVRIRPTTPLPRDMIGTNLRVTVTTAATESEELVVPVAALSAKADSAVRVTVLDRDGELVDVPVRARLSADGFVAVEPVDPGALAEGDRVVVGR